MNESINLIANRMQIIDEIFKFILEKNLEYEVNDYEDGKEYMLSRGWSPKHADVYPVKLILIFNPNNEKNIEIELQEIDGEWIVHDLSFGGCEVELFLNADDYRNILALNLLRSIFDNNFHVITIQDAKTGHWLADSTYCNDELDDQNLDEYYAAVKRIKEEVLPEKWLIFRLKKRRYEFYSWEEYELIVK